MNLLFKAIKRELKYMTIGKMTCRIRRIFRRLRFSLFLAIVICFIMMFELTGCKNKESNDVNDIYEVSTEVIKVEEISTDILTYDISEKTTSLDTSTDNVTTKENNTEIKDNNENEAETRAAEPIESYFEDYKGEPYIIINNNVPYLELDEAKNGVFIKLSELDSLGRCGEAYMCAGPETLPLEERGEIGHIKPSGWHTVKYPDIIEDNYLYNRCHLLMYALSGLNDDEKNLITGTRQFNANEDIGMLHFEKIVLNYITRTNNHVLYKVIPIYDGNNLVAKGVHMQALSVEDNEVAFNVFVYNIQDNITIDYATGESWISEDIGTLTGETTEDKSEDTYILNTNTKKIHHICCESVKDIKEKNKKEYIGDIASICNEGYTKCNLCFN